MDANVPADGLYDFQFRLYDDANTVTGNQVGGDVDLVDLRLFVEEWLCYCPQGWLLK
jgi:hypothetical protein